MNKRTSDTKVTQIWEVLPKNKKLLQEATWEWIKKGFEIQNFIADGNEVLCLFVKRDSWNAWRQRKNAYANNQNPQQTSENADEVIY